jgi:hypothetical protein
MKLYTHHDPDFDLIGSKVDLKKSVFYSNPECPEFKKAYDWLFNLIGTNQVIWCYKEVDFFCWDHGTEEMLWELDVPEEYIACSIHDDVWNSVISNFHYIPDECFTDDDNEVEIINEWEATHNKEQTWRDYIFDSSLTSQILVRAPIKEEWVVSKYWFSGYDIELDYGNIIRRLYNTNKERDKYLEIYKAFLNGKKTSYKVELNDCSFCISINV